MPKRNEWVSEIEHAVNLFPDDDVILVGHSLGGPAVLHYLESTDRKIKGVFLVASPIKSTGFDYAPKMATFYERPFKFERIKNMCEHFSIIHGDNDPFVPFLHAESMSQELGVPIISVKNGAHLNTEAGCFELPELRDAILSIIK
jgi:predicted alpha/beta hydrolase family esterase